MSAPRDTGRPPLRGRPSFLARAAVPTSIESAEAQDGPDAARSNPDVYHVSTDRPYAPYVSTSPQSLHHRFPSQGKSRPSINYDRQKVKPVVGGGQSEGTPQQYGNLSRRRMSLGRTRSISVSNGNMKKSVTNVPPHSEKLGTFSGVFVPTTLNVLSILMFLRFGFILAHGGVIGMMGMLIASYLINLVTTMSISAIATNGTVRGGGAYYLISRSLGPEFGGSIGIVFYLGFVFNTGMNAVGLIDCITQNFGALTGTWSKFVPEGFWLEYIYSTSVLVLCTIICLAGSSMFARASNGLLLILLISTFSIPFSAIFMKPFANDSLGIEFTGFSMSTFKENMFPRLGHGTDSDKILGKETIQSLFGILFPATGGIFAGASMSGDLKNPSKSIPKGTLYGLVLTFFTYAIVVLAMAATITRDSFYVDANIIQDVSLSEVLILLGEFSTSFFSSLMGVIGSAKLLQAIARDSLIPGLSIFSQGSSDDEPTNAIIFTFIVAQLTMLFDINRIASFITMTYLMTFLVVNLACFLLKIGSAPNFRPSFHYFNSWTAFTGTIVSGVTMFYVDGVFASGSVIVLVSLFMLIHYTSPPKSWGDVSQSLIYHQVRKYLLRLKPEHVKFWRPQILLFVKDFEKQSKIISFCNSLKKGGLFILTRIIVAKDFASTVPLVRKEQAAWSRFIEYSKVKAFVNISVAPNAEWGVRSVTLNSGLGGMRPNIVVIPHIDDEPLSPDSQENRNNESDATGGDNTDPNNARTAHKKAVQSYLTVLEDLLFKLRINVAVARGFEKLELPAGKHGLNTKKFIDLWPIQMSAEITADGTENKQNILTTNFDTYTLILQLGCILHTVPSWKTSYKLRINVFVEYESDVDEEFGRVKTLLEKLRIEAEVCVFWLACGDVKSYDYIINGVKPDTDPAVIDHVEKVLKCENWWHEILKLRRSGPDSVQVAKFLKDAETWPPNFSPGGGRRRASTQRFHGLRQLLDSPRRSTTGLSISHGMQTHHLLDSMVHTPSDGSSDESDSSDEFEPYTDLVSDRKPSDVASPHSDEAFIPALNLLDEPSASLSVPQASGSGDITRRARSKSPSRFVSTPMPETRVEESEDTAGPSIMFVDSTPDREEDEPQGSEGRSQPASGFPSQASVALSFNDLPSRAQHLILNELIKSHSDQTAVVFTTLPSPVEATFQDYSASESYIEDLRVLCDGLPACLLVHSNSMTVTMNL